MLIWAKFVGVCLKGWNGQISVFDQGVEGSWAVSKFVSIIGQVVIFVLVADPQSAWPVPFFRRSGIRFSMPLLLRVAMR